MTQLLESVQKLKWLFLDLNSYFASVEQNENPALIGKPVIVLPMLTDSTCAIAASYEAKAFGIKTGTKVYEAKRLCPNLICVPARHQKYVEYHNRIMEEIGKHIPIAKTCSIDEVACRLMDNEQTLDYVTMLAQNIKSGIRTNIGSAIECSIGIAPNAYLAKIASNMQKPDGFTVLHPDSLSKNLFKLKLTDLHGLGGRTERRLNKAGIFTVKQLWNISPKHARQIWGSVEGERLWYKLHGADIQDRKTNKSVIGHSRVLEPSLRHPDRSYAVARHLILKAASRLRDTGLHAGCMSLYIKCTSGERWHNDIKQPPTQDSICFMHHLKTMWAEMLTSLRPIRIHKVSISLYDFYREDQITHDLFESKLKKGNTNTQLSQCLDTINQKYGTNTINIGSAPKPTMGDLGTKIAFTRVPDIKEFIY